MLHCKLQQFVARIASPFDVFCLDNNNNHGLRGEEPGINHLNFYCIKQIDNIFPCVCTVIDHRRRHSV